MAQVATSLNIPDEQRPLDQIPISPVGGEQDRPEAGTKEENDSQDHITVFHSPDNFTVKHPLMNKWTLWFTKPPSGGKVSFWPKPANPFRSPNLGEFQNMHASSWDWHSPAHFL